MDVIFALITFGALIAVIVYAIKTGIRQFKGDKEAAVHNAKRSLSSLLAAVVAFVLFAIVNPGDSTTTEPDVTDEEEEENVEETSASESDDSDETENVDAEEGEPEEEPEPEPVEVTADMSVNIDKEADQVTFSGTTDLVKGSELSYEILNYDDVEDVAEGFIEVGESGEIEETVDISEFASGEISAGIYFLMADQTENIMEMYGEEGSLIEGLGEAEYGLFTLAKETAEPTAEELKADATTIDYAQLEKNPDRHAGEYITYSGEIVEIQEGNDTTIMRLAVTETSYGYDPNEIVWVEYEGYTDFVREDIVTIYGEVFGSYTYTSQAGYEITVPAVIADTIE